MQALHLAQLLLPHVAQGVGGEVQVGQLLQELGQEVVVLHLHWGGGRGGRGRGVFSCFVDVAQG